MTNLRAVAVVVLVAGVAGITTAALSRAPAELRSLQPGKSATDPSLGPRFSADQIRRGAAYRRPGYAAFALATTVQIVTLLVLMRGPLGRLAEGLSRLPGGWPVRSALLAAAVVVILALAGLPVAFVRGYVNAHAWGLSTQDIRGWASDQAKSLALGLLITALAAVAFFGVVRAAPRTWWLWGWLVFSLLTVLLVWLYPVAIAPLFNRFTPLEDAGLTRRIEALGERAGVPVKEVLVADASRRTNLENAYVAGLGGTRQVVLYDTLLAGSHEDAVSFVVAHELGHAKENHVAKGTLLSCAGLFAGFAGLALLARADGPWRWAGASGVGDERGIALLLLLALLAGLVSLPIQNALSRSFESRADAIGVALTRDPPAAIREFRSLALTNIEDLQPPRAVVWALYTHPPTTARIRAVQAQAGG
jgi:Zn-dependent protease with chaperone function